MTTARINPRYWQVTRAIWGMLLVICLALFVSALPLRYAELTTIGSKAAYQLDTSEANLLLEYRVSLEVYAVYLLAFETAQAGLFVVVSALLFWRRPDDYAAVFASLALMVIGVMAPATSEALVNSGRLSPLLTVMQMLRYLLTSLFILTFPDGRFNPRWTRWIALLWTGGSVVVPLFGSNPNSWSPIVQSAGIVLWLGPSLLVLVYRYLKLHTPEQRQQTKWFVLGFLLFIGGMVVRFFALAVVPVLGEPSPLRLLFNTVVFVPIFDTLLFAFVPLAIAASILRYRLYGADLAVNRSLVFMGLSATLAVLFISGFFVIQGILRIIAGDTLDLSLALVIATALVAGTFNPVRRRLQHLVDRQFYHLRVDLDELEKRQNAQFSASDGVLTGTKLGIYEVGQQIGRGGMSEVYRGKHTSLGRDVAIKILPAMLASDEFRARFEREAKTVASLRHPNVVSIFDYGSIDDNYFMVMEYVDGLDLGRYLKSNGKLTVEMARALVQDVAAALDYAHSLGLVHRDVKPSNVMLQQTTTPTPTPPNPNLQAHKAAIWPYRAVLMDFGIAKLTADSTSGLTQTGMIGTLDYAAPEQILNAKQVDHRADLYALGVMAYQMLTGELPFKGGIGEVVFAHLQMPAPNPRNLDPDIPGHVALAILRALSKAPDDRYPSAAEFAQAWSG